MPSKKSRTLTQKNQRIRQALTNISLGFKTLPNEENVTDKDILENIIALKKMTKKEIEKSFNPGLKTIQPNTSHKLYNRITNLLLPDPPPIKEKIKIKISKLDDDLIKMIKSKDGDTAEEKRDKIKEILKDPKRDELDKLELIQNLSKKDVISEADALQIVGQMGKQDIEVPFEEIRVTIEDSKPDLETQRKEDFEAGMLEGLPSTKKAFGLDLPFRYAQKKRQDDINKFGRFSWWNRRKTKADKSKAKQLKRELARLKKAEPAIAIV